MNASKRLPVVGSASCAGLRIDSKSSASGAIADMSALAYVPLLALLVPVILLVPRASVVVPLGVLAASAGLSLLVLDSLFFAENRYHLGAVTLALLAPRTWAFTAVYFEIFPDDLYFWLLLGVVASCARELSTTPSR